MYPAPQGRTTEDQAMKRYIAKTNCCSTPVAFDVDKTAATERPAGFPEVTPIERRLIRRGQLEDPRPAWVAAHGTQVWTTTDYRDGHTVVHALVLCPGCSALNAITTSDGVVGTPNEPPCSHSCERAASIECFCSCGGNNHGSLHITV